MSAIDERDRIDPLHRLVCQLFDLIVLEGIGESLIKRILKEAGVSTRKPQ